MVSITGKFYELLEKFKTKSELLPILRLVDEKKEVKRHNKSESVAARENLEKIAKFNTDLTKCSEEVDKIIVNLGSIQNIIDSAVTHINACKNTAEARRQEANTEQKKRESPVEIEDAQNLEQAIDETSAETVQ